VTIRAVFVNASDKRDVAAGDVVFTEGDVGTEMFCVVSGAIELRRGDKVLNTVGSAGTFGEMALIDHAPRSLTAVAVEPSQIVAIDKRVFLWLVHETPTFALQVMRSLANLVRALDEGFDSTE
jgi:CRP/FNR family cyclic AMP-dependent transcriptional regulator